MTHIVEHKSLRYTWELVRHTYLVDLEEEIEIRQVEISPPHENRLLDPPYPLARFFEIEIDQIQKDGKTVYSFRNICPVKINQKPDWHFLNCHIKIGSSSVTKRIHSQEGEIETRWLYTNDFFLISLSSGDRHDLSMLLSLIIGKLNMIALSIQSGRRIRSEFENQLKYRAAVSSMFSEGVEGAFRDVPVYQQHGEMTGSEIDVSAALMSAELQDLTAECASEKPGGTESVPADAVVPAGISEEAAPDEKTLAEERAPAGEGTATESAPGADRAAEGVQADSTPPESTEALSCNSCGAEISSTTKFCGSCGASVSTAHPAECAPLSSKITADAGDDTSPTSSRSAAGPVVNLKTIEELEDLSWLTD
jgi:hypothetical protein